MQDADGVHGTLSRFPYPEMMQRLLPLPGSAPGVAASLRPHISQLGAARTSIAATVTSAIVAAAPKRTMCYSIKRTWGHLFPSSRSLYLEQNKKKWIRGVSGLASPSSSQSLHHRTGYGPETPPTSFPPTASLRSSAPATRIDQTTFYYRSQRFGYQQQARKNSKMSQAEKYAEEWVVTEPYIDLHTMLGEGPHYEPATNTLRFVDIINKRLHTVDLAKGPSSLKTLQFDTPITVTADIKGQDPQEKLLVGAKYGLAVLDRKTGEYEYLEGAKFEEGERTRSNDGDVDPHGRFWVGTMTDFGRGDFTDEGSLYTFDLLKKSKQTVRSKIVIPNSVGWSPDGKTIFFTDTIAKQMIAWDYDATDGSISNERVFYKHEGTGGPDGFRVDKDGYIWHAIYGESRVIKISPEGKIVGQIKLPTSNITCCEFVGTELFITSAADGAQGDAVKYGGGLFRVDVGTTGLGHHRVKLPCVNGAAAAANGSA